MLLLLLVVVLIMLTDCISKSSHICFVMEYFHYISMYVFFISFLFDYLPIKIAAQVIVMSRRKWKNNKTKIDLMRDIFYINDLSIRISIHFYHSECQHQSRLLSWFFFSSSFNSRLLNNKYHLRFIRLK